MSPVQPRSQGLLFKRMAGRGGNEVGSRSHGCVYKSVYFRVIAFLSKNQTTFLLQPTGSCIIALHCIYWRCKDGGWLCFTSPVLVFCLVYLLSCNFESPCFTIYSAVLQPALEVKCCRTALLLAIIALDFTNVELATTKTMSVACFSREKLLVNVYPSPGPPNITYNQVRSLSMNAIKPGAKTRRIPSICRRHGFHSPP